MLNLIKLSVGSESVETMAAWQASKPAQGPDGLPRHVTRMWPKREAELLDGGSIYWVVKGVVLSNPFHEPYVLSTARHHDLPEIFEEDPVLIRIHLHGFLPFWAYAISIDENSSFCESNIG